jgi:D-alanine-D-alanine ligase-like ATP-grasp enzyme
MRLCIERSNDLAPLPPFPSWLDCTTNTSGYDFRKGQLPIAEIGALAPHANKIYGYHAKWTPDSAAYIGTLRRFGLEQDEPELAKTLKQFAMAVWTLFGFSGYARVDFRVDSSDAPFIIDVNPNPYLSPDAEDVAAAAEAGLSYQELIGRIVESALGLSQASTHASQLLRIA